jgi:iron complex outermembrane recepter protein
LPEKSWNLEMGFRGKLLNRRLFYDLSVYQMWVQDLLVAERVGEDAWVGRNAGASLHRGIESELQWTFMNRTAHRGAGLQELSLRANFTYNHFRFTDFLDRGTDYSGNKIPGVPEHFAWTGIYGQNGWGIYLMPSVQVVGPMAMNDANTRTAGGYALFNLVGGYRPAFRFFTADIFVRANNLLNEHYASMILVNAPTFGNTQPRYYYPGLPRHFMVGLRLIIPGQRSEQQVQEF